jgi:hypothetical protein
MQAHRSFSPTLKENSVTGLRDRTSRGQALDDASDVFGRLDECIYRDARLMVGFWARARPNQVVQQPTASSSSMQPRGDDKA